MPSFRLEHWAAWAPGLDTSEAWLAWACGETYASGDDATAPAVAIPALLRRRANRMGRMALEVLDRLPDTTAPIVFCSRHGELDRTAQLLRELADCGAVSPQGFSMAVHNAIPGLYTIARRDHSNVIAVAGGAHSAMYGLLEACALLADGSARVRLIVSDDVLPEPYLQYADEPQYACAYALQLAAGDQFALDWDAGSSTAPLPEPAALGLLRFLLTKESELRLTSARIAWHLWRQTEGAQVAR